MLANASRIAQILIASAIMSLLLLLGGATPAAAALDPLAASRFSLDLDPFGTGPGLVANTATSVGELELGATINENDILDAGEHFVDAIQIDVVTWADGIPAANPLVEYRYTLDYPTPFLSITSQVSQLISVNAGSSISAAGDSLPDSDGEFVTHVTDSGPTPASSESGEGVLDSLILETSPGAPTGVFLISIRDASHTGPDGIPRAPDALDDTVGIGINTNFGFDDYDAKILSPSALFPSVVDAGATNDLVTDFAGHISGAPFAQNMDLTTTISAPPDCRVDGAGPGGNHVFVASFLSVPLNTATPHQETQQIRCTVPGAQLMTVETCVSLDPFVIDFGSTNNCMSMDIAFDVVAAADLDTDGDGVWDLDEFNCGSDFFNASERPERVDGIFTDVSDDGDLAVDEALPAGSSAFDCDGDGYSGTAENNVYSYIGQLDGDQKTCQEYDTAFPTLDPNQTATPDRACAGLRTSTA